MQLHRAQMYLTPLEEAAIQCLCKPVFSRAPGDERYKHMCQDRLTFDMADSTVRLAMYEIPEEWYANELGSYATSTDF